MLIVSPSTASAIAPHAAERSWIMFVQCNPPVGGQGPIKIEGVKGPAIAPRLRQLAADNAFEAMLIGLVGLPASTNADEAARVVATEYAGSHLHDAWYEATADLLAYIQHYAQTAIQELLALAHPGGLSDAPVDIEEMAKILGCSVPTVRRMTKAGEIPFLRWGRMLRYVPSDVTASINQRRR